MAVPADMLISPRKFRRPPLPPQRPTVSSWVVKWDEDDLRPFLLGPDSVWHVENVISFYVRFPDPDAAVVAFLRNLLELDGPFPSPRHRLRLWRITHTVATVIDARFLAAREPTCEYRRRHGVLRLVAGRDLLV